MRHELVGESIPEISVSRKALDNNKPKSYEANFMSLPRALSFVLKRSTPGQIKKDEIAKVLDEEETLKPMVKEVAALFDEKTGKIVASAVVKVQKMFSKYPALFSTVDIAQFLPETESPEAESATPAKPDNASAPKPLANK